MTKSKALVSGFTLVLASAAIACGSADSKPGDSIGTGGTSSAVGGADSASGGTDSASGGTTSGAGGTTTALGTLFTDDFESGSAKWRISQGVCSIAAEDTNVLSCAQGTNEARAFVDQTWGDYTVTARIKPVLIGAGRRIYLAARVTDSSNWYGAAFYNDTPPAIQIRKKVGGTSSDLATSTFPWVLNQWYLVAFKVSGSTLTMSIDGVTQLTIQDTSFTSGGIALLADQSQVSFDDVTVTNP